MEQCWLCQYTHTSDAKTLSNFIADNIGCASTESIAAQVSSDLMQRFPDAAGTDAATCLQHIECHTLNPVCKLASMLRSLLRLSEELQHNMRKFDDESHPVMDPKLVETYLKVQSQIMAIYRTCETNKLLFSDRNV